jgi:hypothetical protein
MPELLCEHIVDVMVLTLHEYKRGCTSLVRCGQQRFEIVLALGQPQGLTLTEWPALVGVGNVPTD